MKFADTYLGKLRQLVGHRLVLVPGAMVVVLDDAGRVLLGRRGDHHAWGLPAGHSEEGASFRATALSELREETAIEASEDDLLAFASVSEQAVQRYAYPNGDEVHSFALCFVLRHWTGVPTPDGVELLELGFFDSDNRPELGAPAAMALDLFDRYVATGEFQAR